MGTSWLLMELNIHFLAQSFGAVVSIGICAAGVMGLPLVISDYRHKKILKRFKVTPISPALLLIVQVAINALMSIVSLVLVYIVAVIFFNYQMYGSWLSFIGAYFLVMISIYSIGMMVAGVASNIKIANLLCCVLYFPMLIFSGATLPYEIMPTSLQRISDILPLTQGIKLLKATSLGLPIHASLSSIIIMVSIMVVCVSVSIRFFRWE
ncbi:ABC transporter, permease protein [Gottschalkia acidurici 9a]|uniref:ABC transporter, permease protein n=2 Tax=Clostridium acidurici TaxID=1556 RepID=K0AW51_GOTA9|nr:ABC transporter, permease protein [Gottschalkia acidurici 9a]